MKRSFVPVTTQRYLLEREKWLSEIKRGENVSVVFFPKTDRFRRLHQTLEDREFLRKFLGTDKRYLFQLTDFNISLVEDTFDIQEHIARQFNESNLATHPRTFDQWMAYFSKEQIRVVLILADAEKYLTQENKHIPSLLFELTIQYGSTLTLLNLFETDITHPMYDPVLTLSKDLYENLFWYPLYDERDSRGFIDYLRKKWDLEVSKAQEDFIVENCGGHLWLVKEGVREILNQGKLSIDNEAMFYRIDAIYRAMLPSEQKVLEKVALQHASYTDEERRSLAFLTRMNMVANGKLKMGFMKQYLAMRPQSAIRIEVRDDRIHINGVIIDSVFTKKENRVFRALLEHKGEIVSRGTIAQSIWPTQTDQHYSDWAIDQLIKRLRKRLQDLSLSPKLVHVVRGKGYRLNY